MTELSREDAERLVRIEESVVRMEGQFKSFLKRADEDRRDFRARAKAVETRVDGLEKWRYGTGAAVVAGLMYWAQPLMDAMP